MFLHTPLYIAFLATVVTVYWLCPWSQFRKIWLLLASYIFYALFDVRFACLLGLLTLVNYQMGRAIVGGRSPKKLAWLSVLLNLGVLAVFKYSNFFLDSVGIALLALGNSRWPPGLSILLPLGISFYTFQGISYTTEIYRKKLEPAKSWLDFALYLAFFPKVIAGPLIKPLSFLNQMNSEPSSLKRAQFEAAFWLFLKGLFKKVVIADSLAVLTETAFRAASGPNGAAFPTPLYIQGFYLYAFEIYADFSGYTDLARASAAFLGFELPENFQQPYLSSTVTLFWNRWHMTLTLWFREYLFFPLSRAWLLFNGRRHPRLIQACVTFLTMTLIGVWHGAAWTFVAWGTWQGILLILEQGLNLKPKKKWVQPLQGVLTFHLIGLGWILFGSSSFQAASNFLIGLFSLRGMTWLPQFLPPVIVTAAFVLSIDLFERKLLNLLLDRHPYYRPILATAVIFVVASLWLLAQARGVDLRPFVYGRF